MGCSQFLAALAVAAAVIATASAHAQAPSTEPHPLATPGPIEVVVKPSGETWRVIDGDSVEIGGQEWRLQGFDTAEMDGRCEAERRLAIIAQRRLAALLMAATRVEVQDSGERDRHRRPLGTLLVDGQDVGAVLIGELLARPYRGGLRKGWCRRDSRDDLVVAPPPPVRETKRKP
jgi:endonuclease YncB( thermonuclease family)